MKKVIFILGGCRSGKSRHALDLGDQMSGDPHIFIATCIPYDEEMEERIAKHQEERSHIWTTLEVPILLPEAIAEQSQTACVILVDCLTLWMSNILLDSVESKRISEHIQKLTQSLENVQCPIILVSNEVGMGIVPENRLARQFRDAVGSANQAISACADSVIWMVAGNPVTIR